MNKNVRNTMQIPLIEALKRKFPESSISRLKKWLTSSRIQVNGNIVTKPQFQVREKDAIDLSPKKKMIDHRIEILYEDKDLIVVNKPAGLLSVASPTEKENHLHKILKKRLGKVVHPVHRLDQDTSGLILFVYNPLLKEAIKNQFADHSIVRKYEALVSGRLQEKEGIWEHHLVEGMHFTMHVNPLKKGIKAVTYYRVLKEFAHHSLVEFTLHTGKKNQIRVQAAHMNHPILGDKKYGDTSSEMPRLCLHAKELGFYHPHLKKMMKFKKKSPWS